MGKQEGRADAEGGGGGPDAEGGGRVTEILGAASHLRDSLRRPPPSLDVCVGSCCGRRESCAIAAMSASFMQPIIQCRAKLMELSLVTHVPSGPIGCAWAGHFAWQK